MQVTRTPIPEVIILEPKVFGDNRGFFLESFNSDHFQEITGVERKFVQDNHSKSSKFVLRGLHCQIQQPQGKLVRVVEGAVFDVAEDLRRSSPTVRKMGRGASECRKQDAALGARRLAHGFVVLSETAEFLYKMTDFYAPEHERSLLWNDPAIGIE